MDCTAEFIEKYQEIVLLADLTESQSTNINTLQKNTICRSGLVLLCGYFEGFLREMCKEFVNGINDAKLNAQTLPLSLLSEHSTHCLDKFKSHKYELFSTLVQSLSDGKNIELNAEKLSATNANPTVDNIERLFSAFDLPLILDVITLEDFHEFQDMYNYESQVNQSLKTKISNIVNGNLDLELNILAEFEKKWTPKKKRRRIGYIGSIDEILKKRNRIAHGEGDEIITPKDLRDMTNEISKISNKLVEKLDLKLLELSS